MNFVFEIKPPDQRTKHCNKEVGGVACASLAESSKQIERSIKQPEKNIRRDCCENEI
jgi:hypothetical protein